MFAQSKTEAVDLSKINESNANNNLNNELSTQKWDEIEILMKHGNIFASSNSKSTKHNELSIKNMNEPKRKVNIIK